MKNIVPIIPRALPIVYQIIAEMHQMPIPGSDIKDRFGGNLVFWIIGEEQPVLSTRICIPGQEENGLVERFAGFYINSTEKSSRLSEINRLHSSTNSLQPSVDEKDWNVSAWQSRDVENKKWGGGIAIQHSRLAMAFSGFREHDDEYLVTELAYRLNLIGREEALEIFKISSNPWMKKFKRRH